MINKKEFFILFHILDSHNHPQKLNTLIWPVINLKILILWKSINSSTVEKMIGFEKELCSADGLVSVDVGVTEVEKGSFVPVRLI